jgi:hypothetical protein
VPTDSLVSGEDLVSLGIPAPTDEPSRRLGNEPETEAEDDGSDTLEQSRDTPSPGTIPWEVDHGEGDPRGEDRADL